MIVLFIKSDLIRHQLLPGHTCSACGKTNSLDMELHQRYAEFATGKVYPKGVFGVVQCLNCGHTLPASRWTDDLHRTYKQMKVNYKTPLSYWRGAIHTSLGFVLGVVLLVSVLSVAGKIQRTTINEQQHSFTVATSKPTPGITLATISNSQSRYDVWRVSRVNGDTVWLAKHIGNRTLTNFYAETGWSTLPDTEFSPDVVPYSATAFAQNGLKRIADMAHKTRPYEAIIVAVLAK